MNRTADVSETEDAVQTSGELVPQEQGYQPRPCPFAVLGLRERAGSNAVHTRWLDIQSSFDEHGGCEARCLMQAAAVSWIMNARAEGEECLAEISGWESVGFIRVGSLEHELCMEMTSRVPRRVIHLGGIGMPTRSQGSQAKRERALPAAVESPWQVVRTVTEEVRADDDAVDMVLCSPPAYCLWFYFRSGKLHKNWEPYDTEDQDTLRRVWASGARKVSLTGHGGRYDVDLNTMTQTSVETGTQRKMSVHSGPAEDAQ